MRDELRDRLTALTIHLAEHSDGERVEFFQRLFSFYCQHCGRMIKPEEETCHCWNNELSNENS